MNKNFNSSQTLKSSKDCKKFSKSVSYETLVGGTATIGTDIKQTQRLSEGSADKPLDAVGTLTSLLCNSAKVVENLLRHVITRRTSVRRGYLPKEGSHANEESLFASVTWLMRLPRRIQRMLLVMTIPALALLFTIATTTESRAEDVIPTSGTCNSTGTCLWNLDESGKLSISGSGSIDTYVTTEDAMHFEENQPWKELKNKIKSVDIQGVNNISFALFRSYNNITDVNIGYSVKRIEDRAFDHDYLETVIIPASVTYVGVDAFRTRNGENITISDETDTSNWAPYAFNNEGSAKTFYCVGDNNVCFKKIKKYVATSFGGDCINDRGWCLLNDEIKTAIFEYCNGVYFWNGAKCIYEPDVSKRKCCSSCKDMGGWCNRIRYTPAEAAEVLKDDNTNEITITFKK